jgi:hypothetical protein
LSFFRSNKVGTSNLQISAFEQQQAVQKKSKNIRNAEFFQNLNFLQGNRISNFEMKISIVLDLANDYSVNSGVFRDSGNYVKEYANLCSATALYLLALQSEELSECQRQEMVKKCESFIKLQEEIEETRFSIETLSFSPTKRKRKKNSKYDNEAFTSYNPPESIVENQTIDVKEVILAAQQAEQTYYRYPFFY